MRSVKPRLMQLANAEKERRHLRNIEETADMRHERLDYQAEREKIRRLNQRQEGN